MIEKAISALSYLLTGLVLYNIGLTIYRLYFHPLAKSAQRRSKDYMLTVTRFPGPKLAAITGWDEFYRDAIQGGRMIWYIQNLHNEYGREISSNMTQQTADSQARSFAPDQTSYTSETHPSTMSYTPQATEAATNGVERRHLLDRLKQPSQLLAMLTIA